MSRVHEVIHEKFVSANDKLYGIRGRFGKKSFHVSVIATVSMEIFGSLGMYAYLAYAAMVTHSITNGDFGALS